MISVLYVDDEPDLLLVGKIFLERGGEMKVETSVTASDTLSKIAENRYDAIISDYMMPVMDGIEYLKAVRKIGDIPFVLFTGRGREEVVIEAISYGADFYLQKGGDPKSQFAELDHQIRLAIQRRQTEQELRKSREMTQILIDNLPDILILTDTTGVILSVNRTWLERHNFEIGSTIGENIFDILPVPVRESSRGIFARVISERKTLTLTSDYNGYIHENLFRPIFSEQGEIVYIAIFSKTGVEERPLPEDALECADAGIWEFEPVSGRLICTSLSPKKEEIFSHNEWMMRIHPDDISLMKEMYQDHLDEKVPYINLECRISDGENWKRVYIKGRVTRIQNGTPILLTGLWIPIS